jgi:cytoskeletal protein CcmA (bactofilin family)
VPGVKQEKHVSYFSSQPKGGREKGRDNLPAATTPVSVSERPAAVAHTASDMVSKFGAGTLITGNIVCDGTAEIFGRVLGDIQAAQITVGDGAQVEGNITANDVAICGTFNGTVRAQNVKLKGNAKVDGEIFSKSLTVEENVQFEGMSRRLDKAIELQTSAQAASTAQATMSSQAASALGNGGGRPFSLAASNTGSFAAPPANTSTVSPTGA